MPKAPRVKKPLYTVTLELAGEKITKQGETLEEVLKSFNIENPKAKGIFVADKEGKQSRTFASVRTIRMLSYEGMTGQIHRAALIKRLAL